MPIRTEIVGVTQKNTNGAPRQDLLRALAERGETFVYLKPGPNNFASANTIAVCDVDGNQLGSIEEGLAHDIAGIIRGGQEDKPVMAEVVEISGGYNGMEYGCTIEVPDFEFTLKPYVAPEKEQPQWAAIVQYFYWSVIAFASYALWQSVWQWLENGWVSWGVTAVFALLAYELTPYKRSYR